MRVAGCFLEYNGKFLILLRHGHKPDGNTWGLAGGKVETGESDEQAIIRELAEETGYVARPSELEHLGNFPFLSLRGENYIFSTFRIRLAKPHTVKLEASAHNDFAWVSPQECLAKQNLIHDFDTLLKLVGYTPQS
jgi:8-oxo-dGTP pyrophosphatase MutT (NUDIX family)